MESQVLEEDDFTAGKAIDLRFHFRTDTIRRQQNRYSQQFAEPFTYELEAERRVGFTLGATEV